MAEDRQEASSSKAARAFLSKEQLPPQTVSLQLPLLLWVLSHCGHLLLPADSRPSEGRETALLNHTPGIKCLPPAICIEDGFGSLSGGTCWSVPFKAGQRRPTAQHGGWGGGEGGSVGVPVQRVKLTPQRSLWVTWGGDRRWRVPWKQKTSPAHKEFAREGRDDKQK